MQCKLFLNCLICSLGQYFTDNKGSKYMLVHSLASKYARFVVLGRLMYWTPPPHQTILDPPLFKSDTFFLGTKRYWTPPSKLLDTPLNFKNLKEFKQPNIIKLRGIDPSEKNCNKIQHIFSHK